MQSMHEQQIKQLREELDKERATLASLQLRNQGILCENLICDYIIHVLRYRLMAIFYSRGTEVEQIFTGGTVFLKGR